MYVKDKTGKRWMGGGSCFTNVGGLFWTLSVEKKQQIKRTLVGWVEFTDVLFSVVK